MTPPPSPFQLRATRPTTTPRVFLALVLAVLLPSYGLPAAMLLPALSDGLPPYFLDTLLQVIVFAPIVGAILGSPWLLAGVIVWLILHRTNLASLTVALMLGLLIGASLPQVYRLVSVTMDPVAATATVILGPLTALAVWCVAYAGVQTPAPYRPALFS